jgi:hypothetical protein
MRNNIVLLPGSLRVPGYISLAAGIFLLVLRYSFNYKPDFLELKFFAIYIHYINAKYLTIITHQMIEEIGGILLVAGLFFIAFSRERVESEILNQLRLKTFYISSYFNLIYILISILFFYGFGFVGALTFFAVGWLVIYILVFRYLVYRFGQSTEQ